jgi:hypothetical protein
MGTRRRTGVGTGGVAATRLTATIVATNARLPKEQTGMEMGTRKNAQAFRRTAMCVATNAKLRKKR